VSNVFECVVDRKDIEEGWYLLPTLVSVFRFLGGRELIEEDQI
jgi:hypothetical protein